jgi:hypothetical protein
MKTLPAFLVVPLVIMAVCAGFIGGVLYEHHRNGCKIMTAVVPENGRYRVFNATADEVWTIGGKMGKDETKYLLKIDTDSGRVWYWDAHTWDTNYVQGWHAMRYDNTFGGANEFIVPTNTYENW